MPPASVTTQRASAVGALRAMPRLLRRLHVGSADRQRLVGARDLQVLHLGQHGERGARGEELRRAGMDVLGDVHARVGIGLAGLLLDAAQEHVGRGRRAVALVDPGRRLARRRAADARTLSRIGAIRLSQSVASWIQRSFSGALVTKVPRPWNDFTRPSPCSRSMAWRTVTRATPNSCSSSSSVAILVADRPVAVADAPAQHGCHLQVARHAAVGVGAIDGIAGAIGHASCRSPSFPCRMAARGQAG